MILFSVLIPFFKGGFQILFFGLGAKIISPSDYEVFLSFYNEISLLIGLSSFNLLFSINIWLVNKNQQDIEISKSEILSLRLQTSAFVLLIFIIFNNNYHNYTGLIFVFILFVRTLFDVDFGILRSYGFYKKQFFNVIIESAIAVLALVFLYILNYKIELNDLFLVLICSSLLSILIYMFLNKNYDYIKISYYYKLFYLPSKFQTTIFSQGLFLLPFSLLDIILYSGLTYIIKHKYGLQEMSYYSVATKISLMLIAPMMIINNFYIRYFFDQKKDFNFLFKSILLLFVFFLILAVSVDFIGNYIINVIFNESLIPSKKYINDILFSAFGIYILQMCIPISKKLNNIRILSLLLSSTILSFVMIFVIVDHDSIELLTKSFRNGVLVTSFLYISMLYLKIKNKPD